MSDSISNLRRKIGAAGDLQSVVRSMKAMAASNIGQYEQSLLALNDYNRTVELGLAACFREHGTGALNVSQKKKANDRISAVVLGSDQGLIGQFNELVADHAVTELGDLAGKAQIWAVGERVQARFQDKGIKLKGDFTVPNSVNAIVSLVESILIECVAAEIQNKNIELYVYYNHAVSAAEYAPVSQRLLPLDENWLKKLSEIHWPTKTLPEVFGSGTTALRALIREYHFISLFRACAESLASENASRLAAMQRAEKNISELLENLNQSFHRLRQSSIDEELFDVVSGFEALSERK